MKARVADGVIWPTGRSPWGVWVGPPSLEPVLAADRDTAVVSVWASPTDLIAGGLGYERAAETVGPPVVGPGVRGAAARGAPVRFLASALDEETSRLARAALVLGSALGQPPAPEAEAMTAAQVAAVGVGAGLGAGTLAPAPVCRLQWLRAVLEWGGGGHLEVTGAIVARGSDAVASHRTFLLGVVDDGGWPRVAEGLAFPLSWCVRRAPDVAPGHRGGAPAAGILAIDAATPGELEARVELVRAAYAREGRPLVRPRDQLGLAAGMVPWARLSRRLWRRATRSTMAAL